MAGGGGILESFLAGAVGREGVCAQVRGSRQAAQGSCGEGEDEGDEDPRKAERRRSKGGDGPGGGEGRL